MAEPASASTDPILPGFRPKPAKREQHPALAARETIFEHLKCAAIDKAILLAIVDRLEWHGWTPRMSIAEIAERSGAGTATVERVIAFYSDFCLLVRSGKADRTRNVYGFDTAIPSPWLRQRERSGQRRRWTPPRARGASITESQPSITLMDATGDREDRRFAVEKRISPGSETLPEGRDNGAPGEEAGTARETGETCERCEMWPVSHGDGFGVWCSRCVLLMKGRISARRAPALEPVPAPPVVRGDQIDPPRFTEDRR